MFFGRNEESGLRCVYHGWKFDLSKDTCVDMPSEPPDSLFQIEGDDRGVPARRARRHRVDVHGPTRSDTAAAGLRTDARPAAPTASLFEDVLEDCNYLQGLEGGLDTSHSSYLHNERLGDRNWIRNRDGAPRLDVEKTDYGYCYTSTRDMQEDGLYVRVYHYIMPRAPADAQA